MATTGRRFVLAAIGLAVLSACRLEMDVTTTVEEDGSGEIVATVLMDETVRETLRETGLKTQDPEELAELRRRGESTREEGPNPAELLAADVPDGWQGEPVTEGDLEGVTLRGEFSELDDIPDLLGALEGFGDEVVARTGMPTTDVGLPALTRGFTITREGSEFRVAGEPNAEAFEGADGGPNNLLAQLKLSVDLPGGIVEHNADEEDGSTLTWTVAPGEKRSIAATSDLTESTAGGAPWAPLGIGGIVFATAGLVAWRSALRRRRSDGESGGDEPPGPAGVSDDVPVPV